MRDILLQLGSYPEPTPVEAIRQAVGFTAAMGGVLSALAVEVDIRAPSNPVADYLIGLSRLAEEEEGKSRRACLTALEAFSGAASEAGVLGQVLHGKAELYAIGDYVAERARTRDLCIVPIAGPLDGQRSIAEAVVFGSGRPVLVFRPEGAPLTDGGPGSVLLAWDGSRSAASAMAGALPILRRATEVRVLTLVNEKPSARSGLGKDAARHLSMHGLACVVDETDAGGPGVGPAIADHAAAHHCDLVVMGAYGRSRLKEFILGGATEHLMHAPPVPLLLAH